MMPVDYSLLTYATLIEGETTLHACLFLGDEPMQRLLARRQILVCTTRFVHTDMYLSADCLSALAARSLSLSLS